MEKLLSVLKTVPEYVSLQESVSGGRSTAVTGIGQINRSHMIAALHRDCKKPVTVICQDDLSAKKLQEELKAFLGEIPAVLPSRELTLYDTAVVSRAWEQKRLRQFFDLQQGQTAVQILTWEALSQRTISPAVLKQCAFTLEAGHEYILETLIEIKSPRV